MVLQRGSQRKTGRTAGSGGVEADGLDEDLPGAGV